MKLPIPQLESAHLDRRQVSRSFAKFLYDPIRPVGILIHPGIGPIEPFLLRLRGRLIDRGQVPPGPQFVDDLVLDTGDFGARYSRSSRGFDSISRRCNFTLRANWLTLYLWSSQLSLSWDHGGSRGRFDWPDLFDSILNRNFSTGLLLSFEFRRFGFQ
jgi:hypothetical protein